MSNVQSKPRLVLSKPHKTMQSIPNAEKINMTHQDSKTSNKGERVKARVKVRASESKRESKRGEERRGKRVRERNTVCTY